jgi:hypothetical protein
VAKFYAISHAPFAKFVAEKEMTAHMSNSTSVAARSFFDLQPLEARQLMAVLPLSAYYPLVHGAKWQYNTNYDGSALKETTTIDPSLKSVNGVNAFKFTDRYSNGRVESSLENLGSVGQLLLHRESMSSIVATYTPAIPYPRLAKTGAIATQSGDANLLVNSQNLSFDASSSIKVAGFATIVVPAGTFRAVKLAYSVDLTASFATGTRTFQMRETLFFAKGVGLIKSKESTVTFENDHQNQTTKLVTRALRSYTIPAAAPVARSSSPVAARVFCTRCIGASITDQLEL